MRTDRWTDRHEKLKGVFASEPKINQSSTLDSWVCFGNYIYVCLKE